jgi:hypothetical protein
LTGTSPGIKPTRRPGPGAWPVGARNGEGPAGTGTFGSAFTPRRRSGTAIRTLPQVPRDGSPTTSGAILGGVRDTLSSITLGKDPGDALATVPGYEIAIEPPPGELFAAHPPEGRRALTMELRGLLTERNDARVAFIRCRFHRDAAAVYYDSVVAEGPGITQPAWDAFSERQSEMDVAGDHLNLACGNIIEHVLPAR